MKKSLLVVAGMLVLVNPLLAKAETTPLHDFEVHCNETIKLEKIIKMNALTEIKTEGVEYGEVPMVIENNEETVKKVTEKVVEETVVTETITEEKFDVPVEEVIEEEIVIEEEAVIEEEVTHNHETEATCYKCDLPLIHCGCETNPTVTTCEECGLDELHCVCYVTEFPTCDLCGNEFVNCHCEF